MLITDGRDATPTLLIELVRSLPSSTLGPWKVNDGDLAEFWLKVAAAGSPLLTQVDDERVFVTFVWQEPDDADIDTVVVALDAEHVPLAHLAGTDVWYADVEVDRQFAASYCFHLGTGGRLWNEDDHEPWPMSFGDPFNPWPVTEEDAIYPRNIVRADGLAERRALRGTMRVVVPRATLLRGPAVTASFPVLLYSPPHAVTAVETSVPLVILMNGQFVESTDLVEQLDLAIMNGLLPPAIVVIPGSRRGAEQFTAWGWRNGHGPHDLAPYMRQELLPAVRNERAFIAGIHLVAWSYASSGATRTAQRLADVASVTLLHPDSVRSESGATIERSAIAEDVARLIEAGVDVQVADCRATHPNSEEWIWGPAHRLTAGPPYLVAAVTDMIAALSRVLN